MSTNDRSASRDHLWARQFDPASDYPHNSPTLHYAICSTPRSGGHFLCHTLHDALEFGYPLEYLNPANFRQWKARLGETDDVSGFQRIKSLRTDRNGVFGIKLHHAHLASLYRLEARVSEYRFIYLSRNDKKQAISYARASQTKSWISEMPSVKEAAYDWHLIFKRLQAVLTDEARWTAFFIARNLQPLALHYEEVASDPEGTVRRCRAFLGLSLDWRSEIAGHGFLPIPQSDSVSRAWAERFLAETPEEISRIFERGESGKRTPPARHRTRAETALRKLRGKFQ
ncbi:MAG: sulfotransferase domain-containing protein [Rhodospirillales bacterium]|nr:sulfotransferase domain-containing protein [Rhodospirillales bacterium]